MRIDLNDIKASDLFPNAAKEIKTKKDIEALTRAIRAVVEKIIRDGLKRIATRCQSDSAQEKISGWITYIMRPGTYEEYVIEEYSDFSLKYHLRHNGGRPEDSNIIDIPLFFRRDNKWAFSTNNAKPKVLSNNTIIFCLQVLSCWILSYKNLRGTHNEEIEIPSPIADQCLEVLKDKKQSLVRDLLVMFLRKNDKLNSMPLEWTIKLASPDNKNIGTLSFIVYPFFTDWDSVKDASKAINYCVVLIRLNWDQSVSGKERISEDLWKGIIKRGTLKRIAAPKKKEGFIGNNPAPYVDTEIRSILKRIETKVEKSSTEGKDEIGDIPVGLWDDLATTFYVHNDISDDEFIIWVKSFDRSTSYRKTKENAKRAGRMLVPNRAEQSQEKFSWGEYGYQKIWVKNRYRQANYLRESLNRNKIPNHASEARLKRALNSKLRNAKGFLEQLIADQA